jgi:hypothetical protein
MAAAAVTLLHQEGKMPLDAALDKVSRTSGLNKKRLFEYRKKLSLPRMLWT